MRQDWIVIADGCNAIFFNQLSNSNIFGEHLPWHFFASQFHFSCLVQQLDVCFQMCVFFRRKTRGIHGRKEVQALFNFFTLQVFYRLPIFSMIMLDERDRIKFLQFRQSDSTFLFSETSTGEITLSDILSHFGNLFFENLFLLAKLRIRPIDGRCRESRLFLSGLRFSNDCFRLLPLFDFLFHFRNLTTNLFIRTNYPSAQDRADGSRNNQ